MIREKERQRGIDALQRLFDFAHSEQQIATMQSKEAKEVRDFRAMDRHASYALAMQKVHQRVSSFARNLYMHDVSIAKPVACEHRPIDVVQDRDAGAICGSCKKDLGWFCQISPKHFCEYGDDDECCVHCGAPEERQ